MAKLVIVESPTKIKTLSRYLPRGFKVDSCVGHIRDLPDNKRGLPKELQKQPWADFGVDVTRDFRPYYVVDADKKKVIARLKRELDDADELFLATDEDREGESISWHLLEVLKPKVPVRRMVFNEITREAIEEALANPREVDMDLVQAQETRRILDRLYGYSLSPLLWRKIGGNLSAGRVQSVALRLVVTRERERIAFQEAAYWELTARLAKGTEFEAVLAKLDGRGVATGKDFDKETGRIAEGRDVVLLDEARARELEGRLPRLAWTVASAEQKEKQSSPPAPFITSTLQQEANYRLNLSARQAMRTAQRLYEGGLITYMRTDSTALSEEALRGARAAIEREFGRELVTSQARTYEHKQGKGAQEAHEAIRPAGARFVPPAETGLTGKDLELYDLIYRRTLASQMPNERYTSTSVAVDVAEATFHATGKTVDFAGYRLAWPTTFDADKEAPLPALAVGDKPRCLGVEGKAKETNPPARFTEATLVRALEEEGIGRPSTYADIIEKLTQRYVVHKGKALVPTLTAFAVIGLLEKHFTKLVDLKFTAGMEERLDLIAAGEAEWVPYLREFFHGPEGLERMVKDRQASIDPLEARAVDLKGLPFPVRVGRFGPYVEAKLDGETVTASIPEGTTPDELTEDFLQSLLRTKSEGPKPLGTDPATGKKIYLLTGRFGPYFQLGETSEGETRKRASLPRGMAVERATLADAVFLLSLPRPLGDHPDGGKVLAGLGRYGPYVMHDAGGGAKPVYRNLKSADDLRTIDLPQALAVLAAPRAGRGGRGGSGSGAKVLKDFGAHPEDGKPVQLLDGRYGPYVKHDKTNATVPRGRDVATLTMDDAVKLVEERKARGPSKGRRRQ